MSVLVDTHALIWFLEDSRELSSTAKNAIESAESPPLVSHASVWEMAIKLALGKLRLPIPFEELFPERIAALGFSLLPLQIGHFQNLLSLPAHHRDPFDRILIAQARSEKLPIVTHDTQFSSYGLPLIW